MPIVLHLQISENTFFLYKLTENTDVSFYGMMVSWVYMRLCYTDEPLGKNIFLWLLFLPRHASHEG